MKVASLTRTLDQEILALARGASLECLVCGEFVLRADGVVRCPECGAALAAEDRAVSPLQLRLQAG
jgi:uncharacterized Zn finger protein (UPF0148 family)